MASGRRTVEPSASFPALLYLRQIQTITELAEAEKVSRQDVLRELIDRGIEAKREAEQVAA